MAKTFKPGSSTKHRKNRKTLPRENFFGCRGVKLFLLKYVTITVITATVTTFTITTVTTGTITTVLSFVTI